MHFLGSQTLVLSNKRIKDSSSRLLACGAVTLE